MKRVGCSPSSSSAPSPSPRPTGRRATRRTGRARIALYRIAPDKQLDFLKWLAVQDEVAKEAGVATVQLYAHLDGDAWDYAAIWPPTAPEQDKKLDEIRARKGLKVGFPSALSFASCCPGTRTRSRWDPRAPRARAQAAK